MHTRTIAGVTTNATTLTVTFSDGAVVRVPLSCFPRLAQATPRQRARTRLIAGGIGVHWPLIDEDISVDNIMRAHSRLTHHQDAHTSPPVSAQTLLILREPRTHYLAKKHKQAPRKS